MWWGLGIKNNKAFPFFQDKNKGISAAFPRESVFRNNYILGFFHFSAIYFFGFFTFWSIYLFGKFRFRTFVY